MLTVVHDADSPTRMLARRGRCSMRLSATVPARCWPQRCGLRSPPTSRLMPVSLMRTGTGWWCAMAITASARCSRGGRGGVAAPRGNDKRVDPDTGERQRFSSAILPAWVRKSPQMTEVLPLLYLHGLSTSDFGPALEQFLGSGAGLSATTITRLPRSGRTRPRPSRPVICRAPTTSTCGSTASISRCAWSRRSSVCW
ncbi:transposase%2C Mutator family protein [Mycobacteroides abscessus]|nr:transposase%2C Mutator family protein [Mycobacteroides abscessus]